MCNIRLDCGIIHKLATINVEVDMSKTDKKILGTFGYLYCGVLFVIGAASISSFLAIPAVALLLCFYAN